MSKKDFTNSLAETLNVLSGGQITESAAPDTAALDPIPEPKEEEFVYIRLRMNKDVHAALQRTALNEAAGRGKRYSLTELINDILKNYLENSSDTFSKDELN